MVLPRYQNKVLEVKGIKEADAALQDLLARLPQFQRENFEEVGKAMVESAKARTPIDTGRLVSNNKILKVNDKELIVGNPVPYAGFVEYGTIRQRAQPFWTPVINQIAKRFPDALIKDVKAFMDSRRQR